VRVDGEHLRGGAGEQRVGQAEEDGQQARVEPSGLGRRDPGGAVGGEGFALGEGEAAPVGTLREFGLERQAREGVHGVVEVEQEFRGLHACQISLSCEGEPCVRERRRERVERGMVLDAEVAVGALVEAAFTGVHHIERDHARQHDRPRQVLAEDVGVPQPVLETHDDRARLQMGRKGFRGLSGGGGLHRDEH
jgi:hypothetical protein